VNLPTDSDEWLQSKAITVIEPLIPHDAQERVQRAYRQFNQSVRDYIRTETALRLADDSGAIALPVKIVDGFPTGLANVIHHNDDPALWRLILAQPKLGAIIDGLNFLLEGWDAFKSWKHLPATARDAGPALTRTRDVAVELQKLVISQDVREQIRTINEDILGAYFSSANNSSRIELYWMAIALVAAMQGVQIEDLTVVVLAHELTHGYTHIGRDIDGHQWGFRAFRSTGLEVKEGLAQFYTEVVAAKLQSKHPGIYHAYQRLLQLQEGPYLAHTRWLPDEATQRGEAVRFTMIAYRRSGDLLRDDWQEMLQKTSQTLGRR
jgi:hypothetical protein